MTQTMLFLSPVGNEHSVVFIVIKQTIVKRANSLIILINSLDYVHAYGNHAELLQYSLQPLCVININGASNVNPSHYY